MIILVLFINFENGITDINAPMVETPQVEM